MLEASGQRLSLLLPDKPISLRADPVRLAQVFGNIINNACKYSEPGGQIWLAASHQETELVVSIRDTGVGIESSMLPKIFDLFTQIDQSLERSQGGLGIGLALVRNLVEMHGGTVTARSQGVGHGSEFVVRLPIAENRPENDSIKPPAEPDVGSLKVLVVDDNRDSATSIAMLLRLMQNETFVAYDGDQAINSAREFRTDVILLDIGLPKLNGYEVARQIRSSPWGREIILIALTGWAMEEDRRQAEDAGFNGHLVKPVVQSEFKSMITKLRLGRMRKAQRRGPSSENVS